MLIIVSQRQIKQVIKQYWQGQISHKLIQDLQKYLSHLIHEQVKAIVEKVELENRHRELQHLEPLRRLGSEYLNFGSADLLTTNYNSTNGEQ
jgi:hypothetical protein